MTPAELAELADDIDLDVREGFEPKLKLSTYTLLAAALRLAESCEVVRTPNDGSPDRESFDRALLTAYRSARDKAGGTGQA